MEELVSQFFRKLVIIVFTLILLYSGLFYVLGASFSSIFLLIGAVVITPIILFLEIIRLRLQASVFFIICSAFFIYGGAVGINGDVGADYYYFPLFISALLLIKTENLKTLIFTLSVPFILWMLLHWGSDFPLASTILNLELVQNLNFIGSILTTTFCLYFYHKNINKLQDKALEDIKKAHQMELRLDNAQRLAKIGNWEFDFKSQSLYWSKEMYRIFELEGISSDSLYKMYRNRFHPDDLVKVDNAIEGCMKTGLPYVFEHRIIANNGEVKFVLGRGEPIKNSLGEVVGLHGTGQDITEQKRMLGVINLAELKKT